MQKLIDTLAALGAAVALTSCADSSSEVVVEESHSSKQSIVGGTVANTADWPWIASLRLNGSYNCSGTLIAPDWVLTAAHCGTPEAVRVGPDDSTAVIRDVLRVIPHPGFNESTNDNDVALVQLTLAVTGVSPAVLNLDEGFPSSIPFAQATSPAVANTRVAGWGATYDGGDPSPVLMSAAVPVVTNASCATAYADATIFSSNLCTGYLTGGIGTCKGDIGGPLTASFGQPLLSGVASWGRGCAQPGLPSVYARVSSHAAWITQHVTAAKTYSPAAVISIVTSI